MSKLTDRRKFLGMGLVLLSKLNTSRAEVTCQNDELQQIEWNVKKFGVIGDGVNDDTDAIQNVINKVSICGGGIIFFPAGTYCLSRPLVVRNPGTTLAGIGIRSVLLRKGKIGTLPMKKVAAPGGKSTFDQYGVDAIVILQAPEKGYLYNVTIKSLSMQAADCKPMFGIYAPRSSHGIITDVIVANCDVGYLTFNGWMCKFSRVTVTNVNRGFVISDDGSGQGGGTSLSFDNCWVNTAAAVAWDIYGLKYSSFITCGADHVGLQSKNGIAYRFRACESLELSACGVEDLIGVVISANRCTLHITGLNASFLIRPIDSKLSHGMITVSDNSTITIDSSVIRSDVTGASALTIDETSLIYLRGNSFKGLIAPTAGRGIRL